MIYWRAKAAICASSRAVLEKFAPVRAISVASIGLGNISALSTTNFHFYGILDVHETHRVLPSDG